MNEHLRIQATDDVRFGAVVEIELGKATFRGIATNDTGTTSPNQPPNSQNSQGIKVSAGLITPVKPLLWLENLSEELGFVSFKLPQALENFTLENLMLTYNSANGISAECSFSGFLDKFSFNYTSSDYYLGLSIKDFNTTDIPFVGGYIAKCEEKLKSMGLSTSIKNTAVAYSNIQNPTENFTFNQHKISNGVNFFTNFLGMEINYPGENITPKTTEKNAENIPKNIVEKSSNVSPPNANNTNTTTIQTTQPQTPATPSTQSQTGVKWFSLNKTISVITIHRIGISFDDNVVAVLLDISLNVSVLTLTALGLKVGYDLNNSKIVAGLSGFGIGFESGTLSISGLFLKEKSEYTGTIAVKFGDFALTAIGSYDDSTKSLFAYACVMYNFGGPPMFFVKGIALGFGYGKKLTLPTIETVEKFPLVKGVLQGNFTSEDVRQLQETYIKSEPNQNFLAAGVKFTSFGIVDSFALLTVSFGNETEIGLMGISTLTMPPNAGENIEPIAKARLALLATVQPKKGLLKIEARLTSDSYIFSKSCKLTGGFALYVWFNGEHNGDFVITLGGYHPSYRKPKHYPDVPRLGFNWNITNNLSLSGEIYFALTPSAIMAGGRLSAVYQSGSLRAWFIAQADFYIAWKPFRYDISMSISVGASYKTWIKTFKIELGVHLHIWGPNFTGTAKINWFIISFTINFGGGGGTKSLTWDDFKTSFLPSKTVNGKSEISPISLTFNSNPISKKDTKSAENTEIKMYSGNDFSINLISEIPENKVNGAVGVCPMGCCQLTSEITYEIKNVDNPDTKITTTATDIKRNVPYALWGNKAGNPEGKELIEVVSGKKITFPKQELVAFPKYTFISAEFLYESAKKQISNAFRFYNYTEISYSYSDTIGVFAKTVTENKKSRIDFIKSFGVSEKSIDNISNLEKYAKECENLFDEDIIVV
jgi:hypothetical protein